MKRREFVKSLGGVAGSAVLGGMAFTDNGFKKDCSSLKLRPDDHAYWARIRKQFSLPPDYAYFNTGGLGASPYKVTETVKAMMDKENQYPAPGHEPEDWCRIKSKCAGLLGPGVKKEEIALVSCATEGINIILNGLPLKQGDEVIVSSHEHVALSLPLVYKMKQTGIRIRFFEPLSGPPLQQIKDLINRRTRLIFVSHITCTTGQLMPVNQIAELAKRNGIWFALDGAQAMGQIPLDLKQTGVDFYTGSGHKWLLGPNRTGILYVREELLDLLEPSCVGAYSNSQFNFQKKQLKLHKGAQRYEYGTQNEALFMGLGAALEFINDIGIHNIRKHGQDLAQRFARGLENLRFPLILSPQETTAQSSIITFKIPQQVSCTVCQRLEHSKYRLRLVPEANLDSIRASFHIYNSTSQVDGLLDTLKRIRRA